MCFSLLLKSCKDAVGVVVVTDAKDVVGVSAVFRRAVDAVKGMMAVEGRGNGGAVGAVVYDSTGSLFETYELDVISVTHVASGISSIERLVDDGSGLFSKSETRLVDDAYERLVEEYCGSGLF